MTNNILFVRNSLTIDGEPMGVMQLSSQAKRKNFETYLCDAPNLIKSIEKLNPCLIAVTLVSSEYPEFKPFIYKVKSEFGHIPLIIGGPHPTFAPNLIDDVPVDAICVGEGDRAFDEILNRVENGSDFNGIPNVHTKESKGELGELIEDLDELPFIDRELLFNASPAYRRFKLRGFYASRGCAYKCNYCFVHAYNKIYKGLGRIFRRRSVDHLIEEIQMVVKAYPTEFIRFADDIFVYNVDPWLEEFAEKYRKKVNLPFYCLTRSNTVTKEVVRVLKNAGCHSICMSIETANPSIREVVLKRKIDNAQYIKSFDLFNEAGIKIYTNSMTGLPHSTLQDDLDTIDLNIRCKPAFGNFSICVPYPGTEICEYAQENGMLKKDLKWEEITGSSLCHSMFNSFTKKEKLIQKNLAELAPLAIRLPWLKPIITKHLIYFPNNALFRFIRFFTRYYLWKTELIPLKYSFQDLIILASAAIKSDRMTNSKKLMQRTRPK
jgi:anaerobic magnesium-protoporphyrin IX monomethyl ester cyclase